MFRQRRQHTICFAKAFKRRKKSCRVFLSLRQVPWCRGNGKNLRPVTRRWKSAETFTKKRNDDMKRPCRDIQKIIWMIINLRKRCNKTKAATKEGAKADPKVLGADITFFWGSSLTRWQERVEKTIAALYQGGGRRSRKILQGYLYTMIGQGRWKMRQRNWVMIHKMKKWWQTGLQ